MTDLTGNPFASASTLPYELPDFARIADEHYKPALIAGMAEQLAEIAAITNQSSDATFENTVLPLELSGSLLQRVALVFFNKVSSDTNETLSAIEAEVAPLLAAHSDSIYMNQALYARVKTVFEARAALNAEDAWLTEKYYLDFIKAGAHLTAEQRSRVQEINERLAALNAEFGRLLLADTNDLAVHVEDVAELDGLSEAEISAAASAAEARGLDGYVIAAINYSGHPWLASLTNRGLRQRIMQAALSKANRDNDNDTKATLSEMAHLRAERAKLFGDATHAESVIKHQTAGHPDRVHAMLRQIAPAAVRNARKEAGLLQQSITEEGGDFELASWDWDFYADRVRLSKYNVDTAAMRPYFELERVLQDGVFFAANRLFGITFKERPDLKAYHPDARVFEVFEEDGSPMALYIADFYARPSKRGGAWMNNLVNQSLLTGHRPVVVNNLNVPKPPVGTPTLLSFENTTTLFHEFGHALHGMLSKVKYRRVSGTSVQRDFVEFPSQVNEMWILWPEVVQNYARHHETDEPLPQEWIDNLNAASTFNEGHDTTAYLGAAVLDLALHSLEHGQELGDVNTFEAAALADYGLDFEPVPTRYRTTYFAHVFNSGYSAGYYGYIWSEVLDADTVEWFKDNGGLTRANGEHFRQTLLGRGGSIDSLQMFRDFRGRDAEISPLLKRRGLVD